MFKNRFRHKKLTRELCAQRHRYFKLAYSWTRDAMLADDLVQEAMQKAFLSFDKLKDESKLNAWACRIMLNCYRDWLRRQKDQVDIDDIEFSDHSDPDHHFTSQQTSRFVRDSIARLNEKHRNVITLVDLMEFSYEEVSHALEIPIGTVMSRLCRARYQLRQLMEKQGSELSSLKTSTLRRIK